MATYNATHSDVVSRLRQSAAALAQALSGLGARVQVYYSQGYEPANPAIAQKAGRDPLAPEDFLGPDGQGSAIQDLTPDLVDALALAVAAIMPVLNAADLPTYDAAVANLRNLVAAHFQTAGGPLSSIIFTVAGPQ